MMDQKWFEMPEIRKRSFNTAVWIPLHASRYVELIGERGRLGFRAEYFSAATIAVAIDQRIVADELEWEDVCRLHSHCGWVDGDRYVPADVFDRGEFTAVRLTLEQEAYGDEPNEWHLHQDLAITLKLKREGDTWLAPSENYIVVARLKRDEKGLPILLEFRAEHLKDYLCARKMALCLSWYRDREEVVADGGHITWSKNPTTEDIQGGRWEGWKTEISDGGHPFGASSMVMFLGREGVVEAGEDVPTVGPADENLYSKQWTNKFEGEKLFRIEGRLWRSEWVEPAEHSPRVREDELPSAVFFIIDAEGTRCPADQLEATGGWLWFRPEVIMAALNRRRGGLRWYTRNTGGVKKSSGTYIHFGVNKLGLVNVYAKDIGFLPEWEQKIWCGFNVGPDGGVSAELLAAQAEGIPARTQAPEAYLPKAFSLLNEATQANLGFQLFRSHTEFDALLTAAHRFRATDQSGIFALAKDLARLTADSIEAGAIQKIVLPPKGEKWGSLKSLEKFLATKVGAERARSLLGPLAGIYELRHADAHLPGSEINASFDLVGFDRQEPFVFQGYRLLHSCVSSLYEILRALTPEDGTSNAPGDQ